MSLVSFVKFNSINKISISCIIYKSHSLSNLNPNFNKMMTVIKIIRLQKSTENKIHFFAFPMLNINIFTLSKNKIICSFSTFSIWKLMQIKYLNYLESATNSFYFQLIHYTKLFIYKNKLRVGDETRGNILNQTHLLTLDFCFSSDLSFFFLNDSISLSHFFQKK